MDELNFQLGISYLSGKNLSQAESIFKKLSKNKNKFISRKSYHNLALTFQLQGRKNKVEKCFLKAVELGNPMSTRNMGDIYFERGDMEKAKDMYQKSHDLGDGYGSFRLAIFFKNINLIRISSERGCWRAKIYLGYQILLGKTISRDYRDAIEYLSVAFKNIPITHQYYKHVLYLLWFLDHFGDGTPPQTLNETILPYEMNIIMNGGFPSLETRSFYENACWERDRLNFKEAVRLFEMSKDIDNSYLNLGYLYYYGLGVPTDFRKSLEYFERLDISEQVLTLIDDIKTKMNS
jgi:TPR repeat protein